VAARNPLCPSQMQLDRWTAQVRRVSVAVLSGLWFRPCNYSPCVLAETAMQQDVYYIWPMTVWNLPLQDVSREDRKQLAEIALDGYNSYLKDVLPAEKKKSPAWAKQFEHIHEDQLNQGFLRWQKKVFSKRMHIPVEDLNWDGKPVPSVPGVSYKWDAFYKSKQYKTLRKTLMKLGNHYIGSFQENHPGMGRLQILMWAEVFGPMEYQLPHSHTGALLAGAFCVKHKRNPEEAQKLIFKDPRGSNPPFGRTHEYPVTHGEVLFWPSWAPHYVSANPLNTSTVWWHFLMWPEGGARDLDWEDDPTGDFTHQFKTVIRKSKEQPKTKKNKQEL